MPENILTNFQYSRQQQRFTTVATVLPTLPVLTGATQTGYTESDNMVLGNFADTDLLNGEFFVNTEDDRVFLRSNDRILEFITSGGTLDNVSTTGGTWNDVTNVLTYTKSDGVSYTVEIDTFSGLTITNDLNVNGVIYSGGTDLITVMDDRDNYTTGTTLVGTSLHFNTRDSLSAYTADLSSFIDDTNSYTTGATLINNTLYFDRNDTLSAYTADLSGYEVTASNGLTKVGNDIKLGGTLSAPTTILGGGMPLELGTNASRVGALFGWSDFATMTAGPIGDTSATWTLLPGQASMITGDAGYTRVGTPTTYLDIFSGNTTFTDGGNGTGIEYAADYSATYTPNSLITYGDLTGSTPNLTDGNGTTANGSAVDLGGTLTQATTLGGNGQVLSLGGFGDTLGALFGLADFATMTAGAGVTSATWTLAPSAASMISGTDGSVRIGNPTTYLDIFSGNTTFVDGGNGTGIEYAADYSATYTPSSLVTYGDLTGATSGGTNTYLTGHTWSPNTLTSTLSDGSTVDVIIDTFSSLNTTGNMTVGGNLTVTGNTTTTGNNTTNGNSITNGSIISGSTNILDIFALAGTGGAWSGSTGLYSVVPNGQANEATGDYALAGGGSSTASGTTAFAWGAMARATGDGSFAFGSSPDASGIGSICFGPNVVTGDNSLSVGGNNNVSGQNSAAFGGQTTASGNQSFVAGSSSTASGIASAAFGGMCTASGDQSFAACGGNTAGGDSSAAFGNSCATYDSYGFAGGYFAQSSGQTAFAFGETVLADADRSAILGGYWNHVQSGATGASILGGTGNTLTNDAIGSSIVAGLDITGTSANTLYTNNFDLDTNFKYTKSGYGEGKVLMSDENGNASWQTAPNLANADYYLINEASDIGGYLVQQDEISLRTTGNTITNAGVVDDQLLASFATPTGFPGITELSSGVVNLHLHAAQPVGSKETQLYFELYSRTTGGTETLIGASANSGAIGITESEVSTDLAITGITLDVTDRIVTKVYASLPGIGSAPTIDLIVEDGTSSRISLPNEVFNATNYVPYTGATKDLDLGTHNITATDAVFNGMVDIIHTAVATDDHALELDVNAAGFGDVKALDIAYITGAITTGDDEAIILVNVDESTSTGGDVTALEVLATEGSAQVNGMLTGVGVNPIEQLSGTFADMDTALVNATDRTTEFTTIGSDIAMFVADNDTVTIGDANKFEEIEFLLSTLASGGGIAPTFEYSTGVGTWASFTPVDGTNGMRNNGVIAWLDSDIPSWAVGTGSEYLIRITRTKNSLGTVPVESLVQIANAVVYYWDKDGDIVANTFNNVALTTAGSGTTYLDGTGAYSTPDLSSKWDAQSGTYKKVALWTPDGTTLGDSQLEDWGAGSGRGIGVGDFALTDIAINVANSTWDNGVDCRITQSSENYGYGGWFGMSKPSGFRGYGVRGQSVTESGGTSNVSVGVYGHAEGSSTFIPSNITSIGGNFQAAFNQYNTGDTAAVVAYNSFSDHANDNYGIIVDAENGGAGSSYIGKFDDNRTTGVGKYLKCIAADGTAEWATVSGTGETNTASNVGGGTGVFAQKSGADLEFKSITSTGGTVTITEDATTVNVEAAQDYDPRVTSAASTATLTVDSSTTDQSILTAQAAALTIAAPTGSPVQGRKLIIRLKDNGTARAITWNAIFRTMGTTLPTTTVISKTVYIGCIYNSTDSKWDVVSVAQEA